jgi:hypothetical protein
MPGVEKKINRAPLPYRRPIIDARSKRHDRLRGEKLSPERLSAMVKERRISISRSNVFQFNGCWAKGWRGRRRPAAVNLRFDPCSGVAFGLCLPLI